MNSVSGEVTLSQFGLLVKLKWESIRGIKLAILTYCIGCLFSLKELFNVYMFVLEGCLVGDET